jgi:hypothetical protein
MCSPNGKRKPHSVSQIQNILVVGSSTRRICSSSTMTWSIFGGACEPAAPSVDNRDTFECDYDNNPTGLYQAMENEAWLPALDFLETGKWQDALLGTKIFASDDPLTPVIQARTWVTRYDDDGTVRWSQLPLHGAIIFKAPVKIIVMLVELYPQGVRCTDDQHMLPLHLAIKYGAEDIVLRLLVDSFPEAISTKDSKGRLPIQIEGPRHDRTKAMEGIIAYTTKTVRRQHEKSFERELRELREKLSLKDKLIEELDMHNNELERVFKKLQNENDMLKGDIETLERQARLAREPQASSSKPTIRGPMITGPLKVSSTAKNATQAADARPEMSRKKVTKAESRSEMTSPKRATTQADFSPRDGVVTSRDTNNSSPTLSQNSRTKAKKTLLGTSASAAAAAAEAEIEVIGILQDIRGQEEALGSTKTLPTTTEYVSDAEAPASPKATPPTALKNKKSKSPKTYFKKSKSTSTSPQRGRSSPPVDPEEESQASTARAEPEGFRNDEAGPQSQSRGPEPETSRSTTTTPRRSTTADVPGSTTPTDKVIASRQKYHQSRPNADDTNNCETIATTALPKRQMQAAKSKKLPRRGFFKGMGTRE